MSLMTGFQGIRWRKGPVPLVLMLMLALLTSGCMISTSVTLKPYNHVLSGIVVFGDAELDLRMDYAEIRYYGPRNGTVTAGPDGSFRIYNLPGGRYTLDVTTLIGTATASLILDRNRQVTIAIPCPYGFDREMFLDLSNLREVYADEYDRVRRRTGRNLRWHRGASVPVYIDGSTAPRYSAWPAQVEDYIRNEVKNLDGSIGVYFATTWPGYRGLEIGWVPPGSLGENVAGQIDLSDDNGYLYYALLVVDQDYGDISSGPVTRHEIWHSMGAGHVFGDTASLMYPFVTAGQRWGLSPAERQHLTQYAYAIAPNQRVYGTYSTMGTQDVKAQRVAAPPRVITRLRRADGTTQVTEGIPEELKKLKRVQDLLESSETAGASGFLWDSIGE